MCTECKIIQIFLGRIWNWYSILDRFVFFSVFSLKSSVNCQNTKDKTFAPMDDDRSCLRYNDFRVCLFRVKYNIYEYIYGYEHCNVLNVWNSLKYKKKILKFSSFFSSILTMVTQKYPILNHLRDLSISEICSRNNSFLAFVGISR